MRDMKRRLLTLALAACSLLLAGCGGSGSGTHGLALVTNSAGTSGSEEVSAISRGMDTFAAEHSAVAAVYTASADSPEAIEAQFNAAAEDKTAYVLCAGEAMETPLYHAQSAHRNQKYLMFDGVPRAAGANEATIAGNTECVAFNEADMAFLAGAVSVINGSRNILFMTGEMTDTHTEIRNGFLSGVQYALDTIGLSADAVSISSEYAGSDFLTPLRMTEAERQYDAGVELIVTDVPGISKALEKAAESRGTYVATVGFDARGESQTVLFSTCADYAGATAHLLAAFESDKKAFEGGTVKTCGGAEGAVSLNADYTRLAAFSEADLAQLLDAFANGTANSASGSWSFSVAELEPITPDGSAGLTAPVAPTAESTAAVDEPVTTAEGEAVEMDTIA